MLLRAANRIDHAIDVLGRAVSWLTLGVVGLMFAVVVLRYAFSEGSIALQESVLYLHAIVFLLGAAYALRHDAHVRVDIFYQSWSMRGRARADLAGTVLFLLPVCVFMIWISYAYVESSWAVRESSKEPGGLPGVFVLKALIPLSAGLLLTQGVALALRKWLLLREHLSDADHKHPANAR